MLYPEMDSQMLRGEVYLVDFEPTVGHEANKTRPAVIVSNDLANQSAAIHGGVVTVVPITSNTTNVYPFQTLLDADETGLRLDSKTQPEQIRTISVHRLSRRIAQLSHQQISELDEAIRIQLDL